MTLMTSRPQRGRLLSESAIVLSEPLMAVVGVGRSTMASFSRSPFDEALRLRALSAGPARGLWTPLQARSRHPDVERLANFMAGGDNGGGVVLGRLSASLHSLPASEGEALGMRVRDPCPDEAAAHLRRPFSREGRPPA